MSMTFFDCLWATFRWQVYAFLIGLALVIISLLIVYITQHRDKDRPNEDEKSDEEQHFKGEKVEAKVSVGPSWFQFSEIPASVFFKTLQSVNSIIQVIGFLLILIGLAGFFIAASVEPITETCSINTTISAPLGVNLISATYMSSSWDPRMVDFREASDIGIKISLGDSLRLYDLWVYVPETAKGYDVQAKVIVNKIEIGETDIQPLIPGAMLLDDINIINFPHDDWDDAWSTHKDWEEITIELLFFKESKFIDSTNTIISINDTGHAWLFAPPNVTFASIVYAINDGQDMVLDFRGGENTGLNIEVGDNLKIKEVWYNSNSGHENQNLYFQASMFTEDNIQVENMYSPENAIHSGIQQLAGFTSLEWYISSGMQKAILLLIRDDDTVLDRLDIPFSATENIGLITADGNVQPLSVNLLSVSYEAGQWDPRVIDFRTSAEEGIWVDPGYSLRLFDIWLSSPESMPNLDVQAEIYANGEKIGNSTRKALAPGTMLLGDAMVHESVIDIYGFEDVTNAWEMQEEWEILEILLLLYDNGEEKVIGSVNNKIRLNNTGDSWFIVPPYANFSAISYSVNNGPNILMDWREITEKGLGVSPGDELILKEIWYKSRDNDYSVNLYVYAYISSGGYDEALLKSSPPVVFEQGINNLIESSDESIFRWEIPPDKDILVLTLTRDDNTVLDRIIIPLAPSSN